MPLTSLTASPDTATWRDVPVDGARVRLLEAGPADGAPLLFLHGWGLTPRSYAPGLRRLAAAGRRVLAPCLPVPSGGVTLPEQAAAVGRLLDALRRDGPVAVAGHSFGGGVALQLAADRPDLVRSLTLVNTVGGADAGRPGSAWLRWAAGTVGELDPGDVLRLAPTVLRDLLPAVLRRPVAHARAAHTALTASLAGTAEALVADGLPLLLVWADDDRLVPRGTLGGPRSALPAEVVRGRHGWLLTEPDAFAALLLDALDVHEAHEALAARPVACGQ